MTKKMKREEEVKLREGRVKDSQQDNLAMKQLDDLIFMADQFSNKHTKHIRENPITFLARFLKEFKSD